MAYVVEQPTCNKKEKKILRSTCVQIGLLQSLETMIHWNAVKIEKAEFEIYTYSYVVRV